jgi:hypothetical protein
MDAVEKRKLAAAGIEPCPGSQKYQVVLILTNTLR